MTGKRLAQVLCLVLLALTVGACRRTPTPTATPTPVTNTPIPTVVTATPTPTPSRPADLWTERDLVQCRHPGEAVIEVPVNQHEPVGTDDEINTDEDGLGILTFADFLRVEIFRQTGLQVKAAPDPDAPPIVKLYLALGTTLQELQKRAGERVVVTTETGWAMITSVSTKYLISVDEDGVTSVVVYEGEAKIEAQQRVVTLQSGQATFVEPHQAPRPPMDTEMGAVDDWVGGARAAEDVGSIKPVIFPTVAAPTSTSTPTATRTPRATPTATSTATPAGVAVDLTVQSIDRIGVNCVSGTCTTTVIFTIANVGTASAGPFKVFIRGDPGLGQQKTVGISSLAAGAKITLEESLPSDGNCYDPNCTVCITVDSGGQVVESNEGNNELCETWLG